jgi:hypothetical protein
VIDEYARRGQKHGIFSGVGSSDKFLGDIPCGFGTPSVLMASSFDDQVEQVHAGCALSFPVLGHFQEVTLAR